MADDTRPALLVVDDDVFIRSVMRTYLTDHGYDVLVASSGAEALELSRAHAGAIDLLITDLFMPGMGGLELVETLVAERPTLRVIYMSGDPDDGATAEQGQRVLSLYIAKPFTMTALNEAVRALLA
jgi:CheY-like chemotaxis protein